MTKESARTFDPAMLSAWQDELKAIGNAPLKQPCLQRERELLPRFLVAIAMVHSDNRITSAIAMTLFATAIAVSVLLIAAHNRPFSGEISVKPEALLQILPQAGRHGSAG